MKRVTNQCKNCPPPIMIKLLISLTLLAFVAITSAKSVPTNGINLKNVEVLDNDGKYILGWEVVGDEIIFEIEAATLGWVGFGISPTGGMTGADIIIGGVMPDGVPYFEDRFGVGQTVPKVDDHNDWTLLVAMEFALSGKTVLRFSRALNTCDDEDYPIGNDTSRLIWSMGETDVIQYHNTQRGTKSTNLLHADVPEVDLDKVTTWPMILDMEMPDQDTSYWCSFHRGPTLETKNHIVGFDAKLPSSESLRHTHHFILYNCFIPPGSNETMDEVFDDHTVDKGVTGGHCYDEMSPLPIGYCKEYVFVWSKGGKQMVFPENVGYPIGNEPGKLYYMLEIHYDNPDKLTGVQFESGVEFYYTNELREHDAGLVTLGHDVEISLTVPPNTPDFLVVGHCAPGCTEKFPADGLTVFNSLLHSHLSGRKIKTRHFRGNVELPWIDFDDHYDFDYQQNKPLMEYVKVLPGDQVTVECIYDSTWKNGEIVLGGLSTREEMCEAILWYYPKIDIDICGSEYDIDMHIKEFGVTEYHSEMTNTLNKYFIDAPPSLEGDFYNSISFKFNWTEEFKSGYADRRQNGMHVGDCHVRKDGESWYFDVAYPENYEKYVPEDKCANTN